MNTNKLQNIPLVAIPGDSDHITIVCPVCDKGGVWAVPHGFQIAIQGTLLVTCSNGHSWGIYRPWKKEENTHEDFTNC